MTSTSSSPPNRLWFERSLYLRQHGKNPIDWYPWGQEAFSKAKQEDKPILISIGYSACHWCHVMERESFEDPRVAAFQNKHFVSIKVDREERPDVDRIYMTACQLLTGSGGWPLNVFLMPDGRPFFAGTYFPPSSRYGRPGWIELLDRIHRVFTEHRAELESDAHEITLSIQAVETPKGSDEIPPLTLFERTLRSLLGRIDRTHGGLGDAPKFPNVTSLEILALAWLQKKEPLFLDLLRLTLDAMAGGGIYDQIGGGFHRYSVDDSWSVPHFEKMLYDNGLLLRLYTEGFRLTGEPRYRSILQGIWSYLQREMIGPEGCFYASQDADSEGEEGAFFVWRPSEIKALLGDEDGSLACALYGVTDAGNFEHGRTVLSQRQTLAAFATSSKLDLTALSERLVSIQGKLWEARERREKPQRDEKRITAWNGLAIQGLALAGGLLGDAAMLDAAEAAAKVYLSHLADTQGRLHRLLSSPSPYHEAPQTEEAKASWTVPAFLDDWSFLALALLDLFRATGDWSYLQGADRIGEILLDRFYDPASSALCYTDREAEALVITSRSGTDDAIPSSAASAILAFQRLALLREDDLYLRHLPLLFKAYSQDLARSPSGHASLLRCLLRFHEPPRLLVALFPASIFPTPASPSPANADRSNAIPSDPSGSLPLTPRSLLLDLHRLMTPDDLFVCLHEGEALPPAFAHLQIGRRCIDSKPTFYLCTYGLCSEPTHDLEILQKALRRDA